MKIEDVLNERGSRYGTFVNNASTAQNIKLAMAGSRNWATLDSDMRESLDIIASKISRVLTGDPQYADNWVDIAGYATLIADRLEKHAS